MNECFGFHCTCPVCRDLGVCEKCGERIWDKYDGMSKGCKEFQKDGFWFSHCGFCGFQKKLHLV